MKKISIILSFLICAIHSFAQTPTQYVRTSPSLTPADSRLRAILTFGLPITTDTTLNGGLDSLGSMLYDKVRRKVWVRDTIPGGGHKWTDLSGGTGISSLNGLTASSQTFIFGTSGAGPNISSVGSVHTFNLPIASAINTGVLQSSDFIAFTNKVNTSDTAAMLGNYLRSVSLALPSNTFSSPTLFSVAGHIASGSVTFNTQSNNTFLAGPSSGGVGAVSWRPLVNGDLPLSAVTPGSYTNSNVTVNQQGIVVAISNGSSSGGGSGTVTSVGMAVPSAFSVSPSTITTSGIFTISAVGNSLQYINGAGALTVFPNIPAQLNAIAGSGMSITGTFPNLTFTVTGSGGTVTTFSAGTLSPLFTTSVATATTTPALSFVLNTQTAYTVLGNNTASTAAPTFFVPVLASALFQNQGTTTTVLHGNAAGTPTWSSVSLTADVSGNLPVARLNSGTGATGTTFWRGDGTWATPSGGGSVTSVAFSSTDFSVSGSPITGSGTIVANINTNAVTYAKLQQVAAVSLVGNPTGSLANAQGVLLGVGLTYSGGKLAIDTANFKDTIFAVNGLSMLGATSDSIGLGGRLFQNTIISGANAYALTYDSFPAASGRGFRVNFGTTNAGWDMFTRDSVTGYWTRIPKGTIGQSLQMLSAGGIGWATGGAGGFADPMTTAYDMIFRNGSNVTTRIGIGTDGLSLGAQGGVLGYFSPTIWRRTSISTGTSSTVPSSNYMIVFDPASAIATYTLTAPAAPIDNQMFGFTAGGTITSGTVITSLTVSPNSGQTFVGSLPTTITAGQTYTWYYRNTTSSWYPVTSPSTGGGGSSGYSVTTAVNTANYTVPSGRRIFVTLSDLTGQANRNVVLQAAPTSGDEVIIRSVNTAGSTFTWTFTNATVKDMGNNTITTLSPLTTYHFVWDGTQYDITN